MEPRNNLIIALIPAKDSFLFSYILNNYTHATALPTDKELNVNYE